MALKGTSKYKKGFTMFQTMTQIGNIYNTDAKSIGKILYDLKIRDYDHPDQKGFPYEQAITHGIAKAFSGRTGDTFYKYNISSIKEEVEKRIANLPNKEQPSEPSISTGNTDIKRKLKEMLTLLNRVLETGDITMIYRLKADIADMYMLLEKID